MGRSAIRLMPLPGHGAGSTGSGEPATENAVGRALPFQRPPTLVRDPLFISALKPWPGKVGAIYLGLHSTDRAELEQANLCDETGEGSG